VLTHPSSATVSIFQSVAFECSFQSFGVLNIMWKKHGHSLPTTASERVINSSHIITSVLQINRTVGYYSGKYYCVAENIAGKVASLAADLSVQGK